MRYCSFAILALLAFGLIAGPAHSQSTLGTDVKIQLITAGVTAAEQALAEGKRDTARFYLLGVTEMVDKLRTRLPREVSAKYLAVANAAWPNMEENLAGFDATVKEFSPRLTKYSMLMNFMAPHETMGFDEWARYVIGARAIASEAEQCAAAYAAKAPHPAVHLTNIGVNLGAYALFPAQFNILFGESFANEYATKDIVPNAIAKADEVITGVAPDEKAPERVWSAAAQVEQYAGYVLAIDRENAKGDALLAQAKTLTERANALYAAQVKSNRLPADKYDGDGGAELRAQMKALYAAKYLKETVLKVVILGSNWAEFAEAWSEGEAIKAGVFRSLDAAVAVQREDNRCWVYFVRFRRQWTGIGDTFGKLYLSGSLTTSYEILKENVR